MIGIHDARANEGENIRQALCQRRHNGATSRELEAAAVSLTRIRSLRHLAFPCLRNQAESMRTEGDQVLLTGESDGISGKITE